MLPHRDATDSDLVRDQGFREVSDPLPARLLCNTLPIFDELKSRTEMCLSRRDGASLHWSAQTRVAKPAQVCQRTGNRLLAGSRRAYQRVRQLQPSARIMSPRSSKDLLNMAWLTDQRPTSSAETQAALLPYVSLVTQPRVVSAEVQPLPHRDARFPARPSRAPPERSPHQLHLPSSRCSASAVPYDLSEFP